MAATLFSWIDYALFAIISGCGCGIGIYFGIYSKQNTTTDYLFGGKNMKWFPVCMSLVSSALSGLSLLGLPTEIYLHGTQVTIILISIIIANLFNYYVYLAVFYKLQLTSTYEYLNMRFNRQLKNVLSFVAILNGILCLPLFMYGPSLTFSQVSGVDLHIIAPIMILLCIFYTTIGGIKAVVWTDTLQLVVTLVTLFVVIIMGVISVGGFAVLIQRAKDGERLEFFNLSLNPTIRCTFWSALIGNIFSWSGLISLAPAGVQRYLAISSTMVKRVLIIFTIVIIGIKIICFFLGLIIYGKYYDCDPITTGEIKKADQIVPYFIMEITSYLPGFNGLFVAAFFGAAFSTFSTLLNTFAGMVYSDFAHLFIPSKILEEKAGTIMKVFTVLIGITSIGLIYLLEKVGTIFEVIFYIKGVSGGAVLGIFTLGMLAPVANTKGAVGGGIVSVLLMAVIIIKNQMYIWNGTIRHSRKPLHTYGCNATNTTFFTSTVSPITSTVAVWPTESVKEEPLWLFKISFQYYYVIGTMTTILVGFLISWMTRKKTDPEVNPDYLSPLVQRFCCKSRFASKESCKEVVPLKDDKKTNE